MLLSKPFWNCSPVRMNTCQQCWYWVLFVSILFIASFSNYLGPDNSPAWWNRAETELFISFKAVLWLAVELKPKPAGILSNYTHTCTHIHTHRGKFMCVFFVPGLEIWAELAELDSPLMIHSASQQTQVMRRMLWPKSSTLDQRPVFTQQNSDDMSKRTKAKSLLKTKITDGVNQMKSIIFPSRKVDTQEAALLTCNQQCQGAFSRQPVCVLRNCQCCHAFVGS